MSKMLFQSCNRIMMTSVRLLIINWMNIGIHCYMSLVEFFISKCSLQSYCWIWFHIWSRLHPHKLLIKKKYATRKCVVTQYCSHCPLVSSSTALAGIILHSPKHNLCPTKQAVAIQRRTLKGAIPIRQGTIGL